MVHPRADTVGISDRYPSEVDGELPWSDESHWSQRDRHSFTAHRPSDATVDPRSVYNPFVWAIALLPLVWALVLVQWNLESSLVRSIADPLSGLDLSLLLVEVLSFAMSLALALIAFLDWRRLRRAGHPSPFHWAWVFLGPASYLIGRSVILRRRVGTGFAPIWVFSATFVVAIAILIGKLSAAMPAVFGAIIAAT